MATTQFGKIETLLYFMRLNPDVSKRNLQEASDCSFEWRKWEKLLALLQNDAPFPQKIDQIFSSDCENEALKKLCAQRKFFHEAIEQNNREIVEKFVMENKEIKIGYSLSNKTSLAVSLETGIRTNNFDAYSLLISHRFVAPNDSIYGALFDRLTDCDKESITKAKENFFCKPPDSHLHFIYSKTRLATKYNDDLQHEYFARIKRFLTMLNIIPEIIPILKVLETSITLMITFDFENDSVHEMDLLSSRSTWGLCLHESGQIYIAAKRSEKEIVGSLVHEMCHYALNIVFHNDCQPFSKHNLIAKKSFEDLRKEFKEDDYHIPIVKAVFQYPEEKKNAELIVRVPQMIAYYHDDTTTKEIITKKYENLFEYYIKNVLKTVEKYLQDPLKFNRNQAS
jgi:hypothetical protein